MPSQGHALPKITLRICAGSFRPRETKQAEGHQLGTGELGTGALAKRAADSPNVLPRASPPVLKPFPWHPLPCKRVSLHPTTSALSRSHSFTRPTPYHSMLSGRVANRVARATCGKHSTEWRNAKSISTSVASSAANPDHCGRVSTERVGLLRSAPREPSSSCGYRHTASLAIFPGFGLFGRTGNQHRVCSGRARDLGSL